MKKIFKYYYRMLLTLLIFFAIGFGVIWRAASEREKDYAKAISCMQSESIALVKARFEELGNYKESSSFVEAINLFQNGNYIEACNILEKITLQEENVVIPIEWNVQAQFQEGMQLLTSQKYNDAITSFADIISKYSDSEIPEDLLESVKETLNSSYIQYSEALFAQNKYAQAIEWLGKANNTSDTQNRMKEMQYDYAKQLFAVKDYESALTQFLDLDDYIDSSEYVEKIITSDADAQTYKRYQEAIYKTALRHKEDHQNWRAMQEFLSIIDYPGSLNQKKELETVLRSSLKTTVSVGLRYAVAIDLNGKAVSTGYNANYQSNIFGEDWNDLISIAGFSRCTVGLTTDGKVVVTSNSIRNQIESDSKWEDIVAISVGENYIIGLRSDGKLAHAGHDLGDGQCDVDDWENIVSIATGWRHTVALDSKGNVFITGYGSTSQMNQMQKNKAAWSNIIAIAAGGGSNTHPGKGHTVGLRSDGTVVAIGDNQFNQCEVSDWCNIVAVAAGDWFTVGLDSDGRILTTHPDPEVVQLLDPPLFTAASDADKWFDEGIKIVNIAAGGGIVIGLDKDGNAYSIGYNDFNQISNSSKWSNISINSQISQLIST